MTVLAEADLERYLRQAVELSLAHVEKGGIPFTALVVHPRHGVLGTGVNRVLQDRDPTAHAEVVALRAAWAASGSSLAGCTLVASGEPCALCYMVALWCNVGRIVFAVDRHGAAAAGFDYTGSYALFAEPTQRWPIEVRHVPVDGAQAPFDRWLALRSSLIGEDA
jgi:guanine deaminase